jgi:transposase InsO family protein
VKANQERYPVATMCRLLDLSSSGFYAWTKRPPCERECADAQLLERIVQIHQHSRGTYGRPRIQAELRAQGINVSGKRVARLMHQAGIVGVGRRRWISTTQREPTSQPAPDLVQRHFSAPALDTLWVADATYVPTWAGFLYLAIVLDAFSRRIVGWCMDSSLHTSLMQRAVEMAYGQRQPEQVIHHSDHGSQYTSIAFGQRCKELGVVLSMGSVGDCFDNAMAESFFATLECELLDRCTFKTHEEAKMAIFDFIEGWYNPQRRHSSLGYLSPVQFEVHHANYS